MNDLLINGVFPIDVSNLRFWLGLAICIIVPYLLGSVNFAVIFSKSVKNEDIRDFGSRNAGATNMMRVYGRGLSILTFIFDALKGALSVFLGLMLFPLDYFAYICAFFCMLGHAFPIFFGFRGGKGVSTIAGAIIVLNPIVAVILCFVFFFTGYISKYVSLASMVATLLFPALNIVIPFYSLPPFPLEKTLFSVLMPLLVVFLHRKNIVRLFNGTESKAFVKKEKK
ncbi:MAG: glycerol-3-phosphate 1-O-acyltransferase PlsY [Eubacteriales bacterium]